VGRRHQQLLRRHHRQLAPAELAQAGVSEDMVRLSIGIEHVADLIEGILLDHV